MFFLLAQRLFERVRIRLVDLVGDVFADPGAGGVHLERGVFLRHLFHADEDLHRAAALSDWLLAVMECKPAARTKRMSINERRFRFRSTAWPEGLCGGTNAARHCRDCSSAAADSE